MILNRKAHIFQNLMLSEGFAQISHFSPYHMFTP